AGVDGIPVRARRFIVDGELGGTDTARARGFPGYGTPAGANGIPRNRPSCTAVARCSPDSVKNCPVARPRPLEPDGLTESNRNHSSARNGRWNHIAWSRLVPAYPPGPHTSPCRFSTVSNKVRSLA